MDDCTDYLFMKYTNLDYTDCDNNLRNLLFNLCNHCKEFTRRLHYGCKSK